MVVFVILMVAVSIAIVMNVTVVMVVMALPIPLAPSVAPVVTAYTTAAALVASGWVCPFTLLAVWFWLRFQWVRALPCHQVSTQPLLVPISGTPTAQVREHFSCR